MEIIGNNYIREEIYNGVYRYICENGYHFESCGVSYGNVIYGGNVLMNPYVIKKNEDNDGDKEDK